MLNVFTGSLYLILIRSHTVFLHQLPWQPWRVRLSNFVTSSDCETETETIYSAQSRETNEVKSEAESEDDSEEEKETDYDIAEYEPETCNEAERPPQVRPDTGRFSGNLLLCRQTRLNIKVDLSPGHRNTASDVIFFSFSVRNRSKCHFCQVAWFLPLILTQPRALCVSRTPCAEYNKACNGCTKVPAPRLPQISCKMSLSLSGLHSSMITISRFTLGACIQDNSKYRFSQRVNRYLWSSLSLSLPSPCRREVDELAVALWVSVTPTLMLMSTSGMWTTPGWGWRARSSRRSPCTGGTIPRMRRFLTVTTPSWRRRTSGIVSSVRSQTSLTSGTAPAVGIFARDGLEVMTGKRSEKSPM